jgi:multicomponent Na+:H+ antiporter subunit E
MLDLGPTGRAPWLRKYHPRDKRREQLEARSVSITPHGGRNWPRALLTRAARFLGYWVMLSGFRPVDLLVGALTAAAATWVSLRLLPPESGKWRLVALVQLFLRFLRQSISAGIDVASRALDPRLPLRLGIVVYRPLLPPGTTRSAFCTLMSLLPGTLPCGSRDDGGLVIHCLDVTQPVAEQLATEEAFMVHAVGGLRGGR